MGSVSEGIIGTVGVVGGRLSEVYGVSGRGCRWAWAVGQGWRPREGFANYFNPPSWDEEKNSFAARSRVFWAEWAGFRGERVAFFSSLETVATGQAAYARPTIPHSLVQRPYCT